MTFLKFLFAMFLSFLPGILGLFVAPMMGGENIWYNSLNNSSLTPAGWVFPVAWTILYFLIGLALFLVKNKSNTNNRYDKTYEYN